MKQYQPVPIYQQNMTDISVNAASVKPFVNGHLMFRTSLKTNQAGNFNGGGVGNKAILGVSGFNDIALGQLPVIDLTYQMYDSGKIYFNSVLDLNGDGSQLYILAYATSSNGLILGTEYDLGDGKIRYTFDIQNDEFQIVNGPVLEYEQDIGEAWNFKTYKLDTVLAAFPDAKIVDGLSGDGGMPKFVPTPAVCMVLGDSVNNQARCTVVEDLKIGTIQAI